jgi:hypothetical protein
MQTKRIAMLFALAAFFALVLPFSAFAADDKYPNGCVSCHTGAKMSLPTLIKAKVPAHADISKIVTSVPDKCTMCHKAGAKAGALSAVVHKVHSIKDPGATVAVSAFTGNCLNCHAIDAKTNTAVIKKAPKNW